ncbi:MAG: hypothetical protein JW993_13300 [Sedimentisphaerales bacterium]|nr:hypothetical protein [Sedimentisphaerales bacterium]
MNRRAKSTIVVAFLAFLAVAASSCLTSPRMKARGHLRLMSLGKITNVRYEYDRPYKGLPAYYLGLDNVDTARLQKIVGRLSLKKSDFFAYAGLNPPEWWPKEITGRGQVEEVRSLVDALRASGDLVTYRFHQKIKDPSVGKCYLIELYHYPRKKRVFYVKRWVGVVVPATNAGSN